MKQFVNKQNMPMVIVIAMIIWAWLSLISTLIAKLF